MAYTNDELKRIWRNDEQRRAFIKGYRDWGVWVATPELGLTYYRFNLPNGGCILAMEYLRQNYRYNGEGDEFTTTANYYLWLEEVFKPQFSSESEIAEHLKKLKVSLQKDTDKANV